MRLTKHVQLATSPLLDGACTLSMALYNVANWYVRQDLFHTENRLFYIDLYAILRHHPCYVVVHCFALFTISIGGMTIYNKTNIAKRPKIL